VVILGNPKVLSKVSYTAVERQHLEYLYGLVSIHFGTTF
jgi:hypothetical protein